MRNLRGLPGVLVGPSLIAGALWLATTEPWSGSDSLALSILALLVGWGTAIGGE